MQVYMIKDSGGCAFVVASSFVSAINVWQLDWIIDDGAPGEAESLVPTIESITRVSGDSPVLIEESGQKGKE